MPFPMEQQQEPDWCWNAVAISVERYFDPKYKKTQQQFAVQVLGPPPADADQPYNLSMALSKIGLANKNLQGHLTFPDIKSQLDANLPVCVHIAWYEGGSHYVVISGYQFSSVNAPQLLVSDPILQDDNVIVWDYDAFVLAYSPSYAEGAEGEWVDTCLVNP
jgi:hypothetical protein